MISTGEDEYDSVTVKMNGIIPSTSACSADLLEAAPWSN